MISLWQEQLGIGYDGLTYVSTGQRLDATSLQNIVKKVD